ncbi:MAG: methyltransferase domain-containing protein, partial [Planctomycetes bacterium]|nr:methyltransferase domain-containing protein [Planctomycetota bacterium]
CNLACTHCLVSSGPDGDPGLPTGRVLDAIAQARALGARRYCFTGGEPLVRRDATDLAAAVLADPEAELAILTNGTVLRGERLRALAALDRGRLQLQVSLDGAGPETNDPIRGAGSFPRIVEGIRNAVTAGLRVTVTTAISETNVHAVPEVTRLVARLGGRRHHLLWLHQRGRADGAGKDRTPTVGAVAEAVRRARAAGREVGVLVDNHEALKARLHAPPGAKRDLSSACVTSLCVYSDGKVYPSAATANVPELCLGDLAEASLEAIWRGSPVARAFREATVERKPHCPSCPLKFLCGGGDLEHAWFYGGSLDAHDPYCDLHQAMIAEALDEMAAERAAVAPNRRSGFDAPVAVTGMGEGAVHCADPEPTPAVLTSRSECVLAFEIDAPRRVVRDFYARAAETPQAELCCPTRPDPEAIAHVPQEVVERFYGCGSPIDLADIRPGETTLDLGSGAGIDVFIAARRVGPTGRAMGVDMTDAMLRVAAGARREVARNLGYDAAVFLKGYLEAVPVADRSVDLVTSNCVLNLSPDKKRVFAEAWRVLKDHGRICVSDIVSDEAVPAEQRRDPRLWGECISGALTEEEFLAYLERAGFHGLQVLRRSYWKAVESHRFWSVTVRGWKFEKTAGCVYLGQRVVYLGPFASATDEEGHHFPRGAPVEVCTDTAARLSRPPYVGAFLLTDPTRERPADLDGACAPGCC